MEVLPHYYGKTPNFNTQEGRIEAKEEKLLDEIPQPFHNYIESPS
jgi:hypothetical protein